MTGALEGGEWSAARPGRNLPPGKTRYPFYRRLGGPQVRSAQAGKLVPTEIWSRTVQPVVCHYADWATRPTQHDYPYVEQGLNVSASVTPSTQNNITNWWRSLQHLSPQWILWLRRNVTTSLTRYGVTNHRTRASRWRLTKDNTHFTLQSSHKNQSGKLPLRIKWYSYV